MITIDPFRLIAVELCAALRASAGRNREGALILLRAQILLAACLSLSAACAAVVVEVGSQHFTLPDGFTIELAAGSMLVPRPMSASFDDHGRLYVTDSSGSNVPAAEQLKDPRSRVLRLEDSHGDGRYDKAVVFADKVMFPSGCLWHEGWVYVAAPPSIWRFRDRDGDGVADEREEWFKGGTLTSCGDDVHGPYAGPDGYIYWTKGEREEQKHERPGKKPIFDAASHVYRARTDGSDLEVIVSGGMDNPVEVAFSSEGEAFFTSTFIDLSQPGRRDGIAHAVYGGVFGKQHEAVEDRRVTRTSPELLHPIVQFGAGAVSGLCRYEGAGFGTEYRDNLFATTFNLHKVSRHVLRPTGAGFTSANSDFVVSDNPDFHPTDVIEDADGSLLVIDTGGWYKMCCPSAGLSKPDVLGGIYRVRRSAQPHLTNAWAGVRGTLPAGPNELIALLAIDSPARQRRAVEQLVKLGQKAVPALELALLNGVSAQRSTQAAWILFRIGDERAFAALTKALANSDPGVRRVAAKCLALAGNRTASLMPLLRSNDPALQRNAAEAFARSPDPRAVASLLQLSAEAGDDVVLEHEAIFGLIQIANSAALYTGLASGDRGKQRASLVALDQMDGSNLQSADVAPFLSASDRRLRETARWITQRHPEWAEHLAGIFRSRLSDAETSGPDKAEWESQLFLLTKSQGGQQLLADLVTQHGFREDSRIAALTTIASAKLSDPPDSWVRAVSHALGTSDGSSPSAVPKDSALLDAALRSARTWSNSVSLVAAVNLIATDGRRSDATRLKALAVLPKGSALALPEFELLRAALDPSKPVLDRTLAAEAFAKARLGPPQLSALTEILKTVGPLELPKVLGAFDAGGDELLGLQLVGALKNAASVSMLRPELLRPHLAKFSDAVQQAGEKLLASVHQNLAQQTARIEAMLKELKRLDGNIRRGHAIFSNTRAACLTCHIMGYQGGQVGPDLTSIGLFRTERDLLESILYPSASFVRNYEPVIITTKNGEEYSGVIKEEKDEAVLLVTGPGAELRLPRTGLREIGPGTISVMPAGLEEQISRQDLADLLAFLKNTRWGTN
ncbi:MAG: dehydrogenase [Pedosphaera sp.]|nr:dehydrogenase [Pedosphaera sp.]